MSKPNLKDMMAKRNPLAQREAIIPADLYTSTQVDKTTSTQNDKDTSGQVGKSTNPQVVKPTTPQVGKATSSEVVKTTKQQDDKTTSKQLGKPTKPLVEKYTTHLKPETVKAVKREAFESERKDYEIIQEALDSYFGAKKGGGPLTKL